MWCIRCQSKLKHISGAIRFWITLLSYINSSLHTVFFYICAPKKLALLWHSQFSIFSNNASILIKGEHTNSKNEGAFTALFILCLNSLPFHIELILTRYTLAVWWSNAKYFFYLFSNCISIMMSNIYSIS